MAPVGYSLTPSPVECGSYVITRPDYHIYHASGVDGSVGGHAVHVDGSCICYLSICCSKTKVQSSNRIILHRLQFKKHKMTQKYDSYLFKQKHDVQDRTYTIQIETKKLI